MSDLVFSELYPRPGTIPRSLRGVRSRAFSRLKDRLHHQAKLDALAINLAAAQEKRVKAAAGRLQTELEQRGNFEANSRANGRALLQVHSKQHLTTPAAGDAPKDKMLAIMTPLPTEGLGGRAWSQDGAPGMVHTMNSLQTLHISI